MEEDPVVVPDTGLEQELRNTKALLGEQLKAFNTRTKNKVGLIKDLSDFFTQQAEIEHQYAKSLEQLFLKFSKPRQQRGSIAQLATATQNALKKRQGEEVEDFSSQYVLDHEPSGLSSDIWSVLLVQTRKRAESRNRFSQNLSEEMATLLNSLERETSTTAKKCADLTTCLHGELMATFKKMDDSMKYYHVRKAKALKAQENFDKAKEKGLLKKGEKLREKAVNNERVAVQSRNDYILSLVTSNAYKRRYYKVEVGNLVDAMDNNFHESLKYVVQIYHDLSKQTDAIADKALTLVHDSANQISPKVDKTRFFEEYSSLFNDAKMFEFLRFKGDGVSDIQIDQDSLPDYIQRYRDTEQLVLRLDYQIDQERKTLQTIANLRGSVSTALSQTDDGSSKSVENASMYGEAYQRLCLKTCQRACVAAQLEQLGEALGPHRPPRSEFSPSQSLSEITMDSIPGMGGAGLGKRSAAPSDDEDSLGPSRRASSAHKSTHGSVSAGAGTGNGSSEEESSSEEDDESTGGSTSQLQPPKQGRDRAQSMGDAINAAIKGKDDGAKALRTASTSSAVDDAATSEPPMSISRSGSTVSQASLRPAPAPPGPVKKPASTTAPAAAAAAPATAAAPSGSSSATLPSAAAPTSPVKKPERPPEPAVKKQAPVATRKPAPTAPAAKPARPDLPKEGAGKRPSELDPESCKFGASLVDIAARSGREVPLVVESCIRCLEQRGMRDEGIFRVPGSTQQIDDLKTEFERAHDPLSNGLPDGVQTEAVAGLLKLYLRQLEDPLMTGKLYKAFVQVGQIANRNNRIAAIKEAVTQHMPKAHSSVLAVLFPFLHRVSQLSDVNKMTVSNLALVFGPTLMPAPKGDMGAMLRDATAINTLMSTLIDSHEAIFQDLNASAPNIPAPAPPAESQQQQQPSGGGGAKAGSRGGSVSDEAPPPDMAPPAPPAPAEESQRARAKFDYNARADAELSFKKGDILTVYGMPDKNWWNGELNGREGFIAAAYCELIKGGSEPAPSVPAPPPPPVAAAEVSEAPRRAPMMERMDSVDIPPPPPEDDDEPPHMPAPPLPPAGDDSFVSHGAPDEVLSQMYGEDLATFKEEDEEEEAPPSPPPEPRSSTPPPPPPGNDEEEPSPAGFGFGSRAMSRTSSFGPTFAPPPPPPSASRGRGSSMMSMPEEDTFLAAPPPAKPSMDDLPPPPPPADDAEC